MIVGRNAYGALLVLENPNDFGPDSRIAVLDPVRVAYERQPQIDFVGLIGYSLPNGEPAAFLHRGVYDEWRRRSGRFLQEGHILGVKRPLAEGGAMTVDNFAEEEVVSYFERTGATHAGNKPAAPRPAQAKKPRTRKRK
jgi:hypothetical protein